MNELLKESTIKDKQKNIGEYKNNKLKQSIQQINSILEIQECIEREVLWDIVKWLILPLLEPNH